MKGLTALEQDFADLFKDLGRSQGLDDLLMTLLAVCYLETEPVSMTELAQRTGYSLASISTKAKALESIGMMKRCTKPGTKKVYYGLSGGIKEMFRSILQMKLTNMQVVKERVPRILASHKPHTEAERQKIRRIEHYQRTCLRFETILEDALGKVDLL